MATPFRFSARSWLCMGLDHPGGSAFRSRPVSPGYIQHSVQSSRLSGGRAKQRMSASAATESQIRVLIDAVDRADREGNRREAERALAQARAAAPDDPRVLNVAGMRALLGAARARHAGGQLERFDACFDALIGKRRVYAPQPTFMLFPRLPAIEFLERGDFRWLDAFEAAAEEIRAEARAALAQSADDFVPYISKPAGSPVDQWQELNNSKRWSTFFLLKNGERIEEHLARCPRTAALLAAAPLCEIRGHAPTAFFSVLAPRTRIPAHTGVTNTRFIVHMALVVPPSCEFRVGAETRAWREGRAWVFDDTFEHEAWNGSDEPRIVLIFDVWNSYLTPAERDLVAVVTQGVQEYSEGESPFRQGG